MLVAYDPAFIQGAWGCPLPLEVLLVLDRGYTLGCLSVHLLVQAPLRRERLLLETSNLQNGLVRPCVVPVFFLWSFPFPSLVRLH